MSARTYERLRELTQQHLKSGFAVMVDATFLNADALKSFEALGERLGVPSVLMRCAAPEAVLRDRVRARRALRAIPPMPTKPCWTRSCVQKFRCPGHQPWF